MNAATNGQGHDDMGDAMRDALRGGPDAGEWAAVAMAVNTLAAHGTGHANLADWRDACAALGALTSTACAHIAALTPDADERARMLDAMRAAQAVAQLAVGAGGLAEGQDAAPAAPGVSWPCLCVDDGCPCDACDQGATPCARAACRGCSCGPDGGQS